MSLRKSDIGKRFITPLGRYVRFESERGGAYHFAYEDDPADGLALTQDGLRILDEPNAPDAEWIRLGRRLAS